jgi:predicted transcriptional regulator
MVGTNEHLLDTMNNLWYAMSIDSRSRRMVFRMTTPRTYRIDLGWSVRELAQKAKVSPHVARRAEAGEPIQASAARALTDALSRALGREIRPSDIEGLNIL